MAANMAANSDGIVFHFLGTGGAQQVPAFGCECEVCQQAQRDEKNGVVPAVRQSPHKTASS